MRRLIRSSVSWVTALVTAAAVLGCGGTDVPTGPDPAPGDPNNSVATYRVTFDAAWSAATHPTSFPPNPHFSGLIGATHSSGFVMWASGGIATTGIKDMAELGAKTVLRAEVEAAIQAGTADRVLSGGGVGTSPGSVDLTFTIEQDASLVSLVSMVAPSPDWFVGVSGLELRPNGQWIESITIDLFPYDAGTDSGVDFVSPNAVTTPPASIQRLEDTPFAGIAPLGTFTFTRQS